MKKNNIAVKNRYSRVEAPNNTVKATISYLSEKHIKELLVIIMSELDKRNIHQIDFPVNNETWLCASTKEGQSCPICEQQ